jgi:hypothetical protein
VPQLLSVLLITSFPSGLVLSQLICFSWLEWTDAYARFDLFDPWQHDISHPANTTVLYIPEPLCLALHARITIA